MSYAAISRHGSSQLLSASRLLGSRRRDLQALAEESVSLSTSLCAEPALSFNKVCARPRSFRSFARFAEIPDTSSPPRSSPPLAARRVSVRAIRREPISQAQRNAELEEEAKKIDLAPHKLLQKGDPDSMQAIIKDVNPVGYFLTLPSGREGYLPALDLGFTGGIVILERLFKVGQELTVRVVRRGGGGREILSMKKPEFAPNTDPKFVFSERLKQMNQGKS